MQVQGKNEAEELSYVPGENKDDDFSFNILPREGCLKRIFRHYA